MFGTGLVALSIAATGQSAWELYLWERQAASYSERGITAVPSAFAGHRIAFWDNIPRTRTGSQVASRGLLAFIIDGDTSSKSRAEIRAGLEDLGRYHTWLQVWRLADGSGQSTLWITRRRGDGALSYYDIVRIEGDGTVIRETHHGWSLGANYPMYRATQFIQNGALAGVPLSVLDFAAFPVLLLIFPIGTLVTGAFMVRKSRARTSRGVASP